MSPTWRAKWNSNDPRQMMEALANAARVYRQGVEAVSDAQRPQGSPEHGPAESISGAMGGGQSDAASDGGLPSGS